MGNTIITHICSNTNTVKPVFKGNSEEKTLSDKEQALK